MLNLKYYQGVDLYSDGKDEDYLLTKIKENKTLSDIPKSEITWPVFYHLSPVRENILNWYPFKTNANLLEIGSGCGALTAMLCEKVKHLTAVELSKKRASITEARTNTLKNLEIIVGNFNDISFEQKFDYITLIGVLEYAPSFTKSENPFLDFLKKIKKLLKKDGKIFIAIENQFGIKYWSGANEDHLAKPFTGLEGYLNVEHVRTFGKNELEEIIIKTGFKDIKFYYPYPDYKFPEIIFSDKFQPTETDLQVSTPVFSHKRKTLFNEKHVLSELSRNGMFPFFANSFLVECGI